MPIMPLEVKIVTVAFIALLVALIVVYHVWMERRSDAGKRASARRPTHVRAVPDPVEPAPPVSNTAPAPPSGTRPRRAPARRTR